MESRVSLAQGAGGVESHEFIEGVFLAGLAGSDALREDAALIADGSLAMTIDGFVVDPPDFPGGDIGKLAVCGTVNDLAVRGAVPRWMAVSWILPEGMPVDAVRRYADSLARTAAEVGVRVVAGDTKVVPERDMASLSVTTCGVGEVRYPSSIGSVRPGDVLLLSGGLGAHTAALIARREGLLVDGLPESDCAPLHELAFDAFRAGAHFARDATRGGVAAVLWELARAAAADVRLDRAACHVHPAVAELCELLGLDPLYLANEGCLLLAAPPDRAEDVLAALRRHEGGRAAAIVGAVAAGPTGVQAGLDGRLLPLPAGGLAIPRLC
jgi:hydrogenase expression/formation protein HypE